MGSLDECPISPSPSTIDSLSKLYTNMGLTTVLKLPSLVLLVSLTLGALPVHAEPLPPYTAREYLTVAQATQPPTPAKSKKTATTREQILSLVKQVSIRYDINPRLIEAVIAVESSFNPRAVSKAGAQGLMQLMPATAKRFQVENVFDPKANIEGGVRYLKFLMNRYKRNIRYVLAAYNAGEGAVDRYAGVPPYPETRQYVLRVLGYYSKKSATAAAYSRTFPGRPSTRPAIKREPYSSLRSFSISRKNSLSNVKKLSRPMCFTCRKPKFAPKKYRRISP